jgi:hypothetical protein
MTRTIFAAHTVGPRLAVGACLATVAAVTSASLAATAHAEPKSDQVGYVECLAAAWNDPGRRINPDGTVTEEWMLECCALNNGTWKNGDCTFNAQNQVQTPHGISGLPLETLTPMPTKPSTSSR